LTSILFAFYIEQGSQAFFSVKIYTDASKN
jgi:hypothetical protein